MEFEAWLDAHHDSLIQHHEAEAPDSSVGSTPSLSQRDSPTWHGLIEEEEELSSATRHDRVEEGGGALLSYLVRPTGREKGSLLLLGKAEKKKKEELSSPTRHGRIEEGKGALLSYSAAGRSSLFLTGTAE